MLVMIRRYFSNEKEKLEKLIDTRKSVDELINRYVERNRMKDTCRETVAEQRRKSTGS